MRNFFPYSGGPLVGLANDQCAWRAKEALKCKVFPKALRGLFIPPVNVALPLDGGGARHETARSSRRMCSQQPI